MAMPWARNAELYHVGTKRHSGRYAYGSGEYPYQHEPWFAGFGDGESTSSDTLTVGDKEYKGYGGYSKSELWTKDEDGKTLPEKDIADALGISTTELRAVRNAWRTQSDNDSRAYAQKLLDTGMSKNAVAKKMGMSYSSLDNLLGDVSVNRAKRKNNTVEALRAAVDDNGYIDVGQGVDSMLGIGPTSLASALKTLEEEGYVVKTIGVPQAQNAIRKTNTKVLAQPGTTTKEIYDNLESIKPPVGTYTTDNGLTWEGIENPASVSSDRVMVRYPKDGGDTKDGVIEIRRGVADLDLGDNLYAQVRIAVDGTHYLKGMAVYSDDMPEGVDIVFNTSKANDMPMIGPKGNTVLKNLKDDEDNPFGSTVRQSHYVDENGETQLSAINIVNDDSDWAKWSRTLSSQFLSKQSPYLAKQQLDLTYQQRVEEYNEIMSISNNEVRRYLLDEFADNCDSSAVDLKAVALPGQAAHVILPCDSLQENEVYAPSYENGEQIALIRYPHASITEIPVLTVNNSNVDCKKMIGNSSVAIGINAAAAKQLSGADFDGDTVTCIPLSSTGVPLKYKKMYEELENFDHHTLYAKSSDEPATGPATGFHTNAEMGRISNLITDMTIKGASDPEIVRALKHSMVIIDAEKHNLDWRQSEIDNGIQELKDKWQDGGGASTLISRAKGDERVPERKTSKVNKETGEVEWINSNREYQVPVVKVVWTDDRGKTHTNNKTVSWKKYKELQEDDSVSVELTGTKSKEAQTKSSKMAETSDAFTLASDPNNPTLIETIYGNYANSLKKLATQARLESSNTETGKIVSSAASVYKDETESIVEKWRTSVRNSPLERLAQRVANVVIKSKMEANNYSKDQAKRMKKHVVEAAREKFGALPRKKRYIQLTDKEWDALVSGALSANTTRNVLKEMDTSDIKRRAMPRTTSALTAGQIGRAKALLNSGNRTWAEVASIMGVSVTTLQNAIRKS